MTQATPNNYWIAPNALTITLNALGNTEYLQVTVASGASILCYMKGITGLGYDNGHNYRRWTLNAYPTVFSDSKKKYVYAAIHRTDDTKPALICFPSEKIDIYGCTHSNDGEDDDVTTQVGSADYYYIFLQGIITESQTDAQREASSTSYTNREWTDHINTGTLSTDEALNSREDEWWSYSSDYDIVTFLKDITFKIGKRFINLFTEKITFRDANTPIDKNKGVLESVPEYTSLETNDSTAAVSTAYLKAFYDKLGNDIFLRKDQDDETTHKLTMAEAHVKGAATVDGTATFKGTSDFGQYEKGLSGGRITNEGDAELKSLVLRESLTVPKLTYNCEEWIGGNTWRSQGGGIIKAVADITTTASSQVSTGASAGVKHIALLDILANEGGKIAANDKCQGIFHITSPSLSSNALLDDRDYHNGHFTFRGFTTIYFLVKEVMSDQWIEDNAQALKTAFNLTTEELNALKGMNAFFEYNLRSEVDTTWTDSTHPQPQLNFAAYANETTASRQQVHLSTPQYDIYLVGMTQWTYAEENIQMILGLLDGFTINRTKWDVAQGKFVDADPVSLTGYGIAFGKAYMWGNIEQFDRAPSLVSQQLYCKASASTTALTVAQIGTATDSQATEDLRFLWGYWHYLYSDGQTKDSNVFLAANYGKEGKDAVIYSLVPEQTGIKIAADGTYSEERLTVLVQKNEAGKVTPSINPADANLKIYLIVDFEYEGTDTDTLEGDDGEALDFGDDDNITYLNPIPFPEGGIILGGEGEGHISPQNNVKFILVDDSVTITDDYRGICIDTKTIPVSKDGAKGDKGDPSKTVLRPCGEWIEGNTYVHNDQWIDVVIYNEVFYAVREGITETTAVPTDNNVWEQANMLKFVATDILMSNIIYTKVLQAVNAKIDELVVKRLETISDDCHISIQDGLMQVFAGDNAQPNIVFGIDDEGHSVMKYYDNDGTYLYNLGPDGIKNLVDVIYAKYTLVTMYLMSNSDNYLGNDIDPLDTPIYNTASIFSAKNIYQWVQGRKKIGNLYYYTSYQSSSASEDIWQGTQYAYSGRYFNSQADSPNVQPTSLFHGVMATYNPSEASGSSYSGVMYVPIYLYYKGQQKNQFILYVKVISGYTYFCKKSGEDYNITSNTTLRDYLTDTGQITA